MPELNPPPGWPAPPPGWRPPRDGQPPPSWPPPPPGWPLWVEPGAAVHEASAAAPRVLVTKVANALVEDVRMDLAPGVDVALGAVGGVPPAVDLVLEGFRRRWGGLWVGGRVIVSERDVVFAANAMNRMVQSGTLDVVVPLASVTSVRVQRALLTNIVVIGAGYHLLKVRCFGASTLAGVIEQVAGSAPEGPATDR